MGPWLSMDWFFYSLVLHSARDSCCRNTESPMIKSPTYDAQHGKKKTLCHMQTVKVQMRVHINAVWPGHSLFIDIYYNIDSVSRQQRFWSACTNAYVVRKLPYYVKCLGVIFHWGSTLKVSFALPVTSRHRCDRTERLLKATWSPNKTNEHHMQISFLLFCESKDLHV